MPTMSRFSNKLTVRHPNPAVRSEPDRTQKIQRDGWGDERFLPFKGTPFAPKSAI